MAQAPNAGGVAPNRATILVIDDDEAIVCLFSRVLRHEGFQVETAMDGQSGLDALRRIRPDVVLLDVSLPRLDGFIVCREVKSDAATRLTPVILVTAFNTPQDRIAGITAGADDFITKPVDLEQLKARVRSLARLKRYTDDLERAESVILSLALTVEARDPFTEGHCRRLATYAVRLGRDLGLDRDTLAALRRGAYLHDLGKIGIADAILHKSAPLTEAEFEKMKQHTIIGERLCGNLRSLALVRPIVRHHHERLDGTGYPDGLRGDQVPLLAQIVAIADVYDAMTTSRPYRVAQSLTYAADELQAEARLGRLDEDLIDRFLRLLRIPVTHLIS